GGASSATNDQRPTDVAEGLVQCASVATAASARGYTHGARTHDRHAWGDVGPPRDGSRPGPALHAQPECEYRPFALSAVGPVHVSFTGGATRQVARAVLHLRRRSRGAWIPAGRRAQPPA